MKSSKKITSGDINVTLIEGDFSAAEVASEIRSACRGRIMVVSTEKLLLLSGLFAVKKRGVSACDSFCVLPRDGEPCKTMATVETILKSLISGGFKKSDTLVAIGGGTVCDVAAFAASIYKRGIGLVLVPTTLLGMVDAAVGGKTAINFKGIKNSVGTVYFSDETIVWPGFLKTLPCREAECGLFEIVKSALLFSPAMLRELSESFGTLLNFQPGAEKRIGKIIAECIEKKASLASRDPFDCGVRMYLNLGHTVAHAIEAASGNAVSHGHAVGAGLFTEAVVAKKLGVLTDRNVIPSVAGFIRATGAYNVLEKWVFSKNKLEAVKKAVVYDKKAGRRNSLTMPLTVRTGKTVLYEADIDSELLPLLDAGLLLDEWNENEKGRSLS